MILATTLSKHKNYSHIIRPLPLLLREPLLVRYVVAQLTKHVHCVHMHISLQLRQAS